MTKKAKKTLWAVARAIDNQTNPNPTLRTHPTLMKLLILSVAQGEVVRFLEEINTFADTLSPEGGSEYTMAISLSMFKDITPLVYETACNELGETLDPNLSPSQQLHFIADNFDKILEKVDAEH